MLGLRFNLTPAQTQLLVVIANECYEQIDNSGHLLPDYDSSYFITTIRSLQAKGFVSHDCNRKPSWQPTTAGKAIAALVEAQCEELLQYRDRQKTVRRHSDGKIYPLRKTAKQR